MSVRSVVENNDTISLVCALLVRYPEIASIRSMPGEGAVRLSFAVNSRLDRSARRTISEQIEAHAAGFMTLARETGEVLVECESARGLSFVHVTRDLNTFSKDELTMMTDLLGERFGTALVRNPVQEDRGDEDPIAEEELVDAAIDALRDPSQSRSLVGFHEEKNVLVYFLKAQKKAKASARR